jgi:hypothetical protein
VVLCPTAWWQHAIGAVLSERRDLLHQEVGRRLPARTLWRLRQQYTAAYLGVQQGHGGANVRIGWKKPWGGLAPLKVSTLRSPHCTSVSNLQQGDAPNVRDCCMAFEDSAIRLSHLTALVRVVSSVI